MEVPEGPWGIHGGPWRVPGGSLGWPWRSLKVPWRLPDTNLVQSVQLFKTSLGLEQKQYYRSSTRISHFPMILREAAWRLLGSPWSSLEGPWRSWGIPRDPWSVPGGSLGGAWRSLEGPWKVSGVALEIPKGPLEAS